MTVATFTALVSFEGPQRDLCRALIAAGVQVFELRSLASDCRDLAEQRRRLGDDAMAELWLRAADYVERDRDEE